MPPISTPLLALWVSGHKVPDDSMRQLVSLTYTDREKKASDGTMVFTDVGNEIADSNVFKKGRRISFLMGWVSEAMPRGVFMVKKYSYSAGIDGIPRLTVKFQDLSHKMNKKQKRRKHLGKPVDIIKKIAKEHGLGYDIESLADLLFDQSQPLIQAGITDAKLLQTLARTYGYVWGIEGTTLYFRRPNSLDFTGKQRTVPRLSYKSNNNTLLSFNADVKYHNKGKRKGSKQKSDDIDLESDNPVGEMLTNSVEMIRDGVNKAIPGLSGILSMDANQSGDDQEEKPRSSKDSKGTSKTEFKVDYAAGAGAWSTLVNAVMGTDDSAKDEPNEETTEAAGTADGDKNKKKKAAVILGVTEIIDATLIPTRASMMYRAGMAVEVVGVGARFSGKYHVTEATHSYSNSGFSTSLKTIKRSFKQTAAGRAAAKKEAEDIAEQGEIAKGGTGESAPSGEAFRKNYTADAGMWGTKIVKLVDGKEDV